MKFYVCDLCGYELDPVKGDEENGIVPDTEFEDLPCDFICPMCGASKENFEIVEREED